MSGDIWQHLAKPSSGFLPTRTQPVKSLSVYFTVSYGIPGRSVRLFVLKNGIQVVSQSIFFLFLFQFTNGNKHKLELFFMALYSPALDF